MLPEIWHRAVDGLVTECSTKVLVLGSFGLLLGKVSDGLSSGVGPLVCAVSRGGLTLTFQGHRLYEKARKSLS